MRARATWLLPLLLPVVACDDKGGEIGPGSDLQELNERWDRWQAVEPAAYDYEFQWVCFCVDEVTQPVRVAVGESIVQSVTVIETGEPVDPDVLATYRTINELFLLLERAYEDGADQVRVEYDAELGYPVDAFIDYDFGVADEELGFSASNVSEQ